MRQIGISLGINRADRICKMSWLSWSADIKKRSCKYLLQRYVGHLVEDLSLDQLTIDLYNGTCQVVNLGLNVQVSNLSLSQIIAHHPPLLLWRI